MTIYWIACIASVYLAAAVLQVNHERDDIRYYVTLAFCASLPLNFICSIRYNVGKDYLSYKAYFNLIANGSTVYSPGSIYVDIMANGRSIAQIEPLYFLINKVIALLGGDYRWLFAVTSTIFLVMVFLEIYRASPSPPQSVFLLVAMSSYFFFMNGMRQMIGCSILMYSLRYIEEQRLRPFILCVLVACGFHMSCFPFLVVYFVGTIDFKPKNIILMTGSMFVFASLLGSALSKVMMMTDYGRYIGSDFDKGQQGIIVLVINGLLVALGLLYYDEEDVRFRLYLNLQMVTLWITILTGHVALIDRLRWMFGLPGIVLLPIIFSKIEDVPTRRFITCCVIGAFFVYCSYRILVFNANNVLPYRTIFSV